MTRLLKRAFDKASKLPPKAQDSLGAWILEELADEARWNETFARTQDQLARLADEVRSQVKAGKTLPLDFSQRRR